MWGDNWRKHFSVDEVNGNPGHELKYDGRTLITGYLRVGTHSDGTWRVYKMRQDFVAAKKVQTEDDISASVVVPTKYVKGLNKHINSESIKLVVNCENHLFQRPDDAINRGLDKQTESDLAGNNNFISNFEPLTSRDARELVEDAIHFQDYSAPMRKRIRDAAKKPDSEYFVSSAHPRIVNGKPSPNVRYLQRRPDLAIQGTSI